MNTQFRETVFIGSKCDNSIKRKWDAPIVQKTIVQKTATKGNGDKTAREALSLAESSADEKLHAASAFGRTPLLHQPHKAHGSKTRVDTPTCLSLFGDTSRTPFTDDRRYSWGQMLAIPRHRHRDRRLPEISAGAFKSPRPFRRMVTAARDTSYSCMSASVKSM